MNAETWRQVARELNSITQLARGAPSVAAPEVCPVLAAGKGSKRAA